MVVWDGRRLALMGAATGLAGSLWLTRFLSAMPFETSRFDALTVGAVGGVLAVVALFACVIPARRATLADPVTALREE